MRAIVLRGPGDLAVTDVPIPQPKPGEALLRVTDVGICGSDVRYLHGENPWAQQTLGRSEENPPNIIPGHEVVGIIEGVGEGVPRDRIGERVAVLSFRVDGTCVWCRRDRQELCPNTQHLGHGAGWGNADYYYGGMAEYVSVWADHCFTLPDAVSSEAASLLDPLAVAVHAVRLANVAPGDSVLTVGAGPVGLLILQVSRVFGATWTVATDLSDDILDTARVLGADRTINVRKENLETVIREATGGRGVWVVFDTVGLPLASTLPLVSRGGRLMLLAVKPREETFSTMLLAGEKSISVVANFRYPDYPVAIDLLATGRVRVEPLITHRYPLEAGLEAFATAEAKDENGAIKVLLKPGTDGEPEKG